MDKWRSQYREPNVAKLGAKQWNNAAHKRVEQNQYNLLWGGLQAHNNNTKGRIMGTKSILTIANPDNKFCASFGTDVIESI